MNAKPWLGTLSVAAVLAAAACSSSGASDGGAGGAVDLKVGVVLPFTGDLSPYGPSLDKSAQFGIDMVNEALKKDGLTDKITYVGSSPASGVEAARKLVSTKKANVIIGSMSSGVTIAIAKSVTIPSNVLLVTPTSSDPGITGLADNGLVFRVYPPDDFQAKALADSIAKTYGKDATVNVGGRNDAFGTALTASFKEEWEKNGGKVGALVTYDPKSATFDSTAQQLTAGDPKAWVIADFPPTFAKLAPALVRTGKWRPADTFMTEAMQNKDELIKIGAPATAGLRGTAASSEGGTDPGAFEAAYKAKFPGQTYTGFEATSFDSVVITSLASIKAGSNDPAKVKEAMLSVSNPDGEKFTWQQLPEAIKAIKAGKTINYEGAWTQVAFDKNGDPMVSTFVLWKWDGAAMSNVETFNFTSK